MFSKMVIIDGPYFFSSSRLATLDGCSEVADRMIIFFLGAIILDMVSIG